MTEVMAILFVDVHSSKAKLTIYHDGNCFFIASTVSAYALQQMMLRVEADSSTIPLPNTLYDRQSPRFDIGFHGIFAVTNSNMR
jgi:hypothetical protein